MDVKDYITIPMAAVGCILGIVNFWRSLRLEKRSFFEHSFKDKWPVNRNTLTVHLDAVDRWLDQIESKNKDRGYIRHIRNEGDVKLDLNAPLVNRVVNRTPQNRNHA